MDVEARFRELDHLFDDAEESTLDVGKIDVILRELTQGFVGAILNQRIEGIIAPYYAGFNRLSHELGWRCDENPENASLNFVRGRVEQIIDTLDVGDNTALYTRDINAVKENPVYLMILQLLESRGGQEVLINELGVDNSTLDSTLVWMEDRQLIVMNRSTSTVTFGQRGRGTLEAALEELRHN